MAITFFGSTGKPTDNQAGGIGNVTTVGLVTPPGSMVSGDLCVFISVYDNPTTTRDWAPMIGNGDGQAWNDLANHNGVPQNYRVHWCQYNGTWTANPQNSYSGTALNNGTSAVLLVWRPTSSGTLPWTVDLGGGETTSAYTAPTTPFNVVTPGQTPVTASTVSLAIWTSLEGTGGATTWALQTGGWTNPSGATQWRNLYGSSPGPSISAAYKIQTSAAATGSVTNQQNAVGHPGWQTMITFAEAAAAAPVFKFSKEGGFSEMQGGFSGA
jgi:hypothetical protein